MGAIEARDQPHTRIGKRRRDALQIIRRHANIGVVDDQNLDIARLRTRSMQHADLGIRRFGRGIRRGERDGNSRMQRRPPDRRGIATPHSSSKFTAQRNVRSDRLTKSRIRSANRLQNRNGSLIG